MGAAHERRGSRPWSLAIVISGQVRTFVDPRVHLSIRDNLVRALCPRDQCIPTLVLCVELGHCSSNYGDQTWQKAQALSRLKAAVAALGVQTPGDIAWPAAQCSREEQELSCLPEQRDWCDGPRRQCRSLAADATINPDLAQWNASRRRPKNPPPLGPPRAHQPVKYVQGLVRWLHCLPRLLEAERHRRGAFDWVVVLRPDVAYFDRLPSLRAFAAHGHGVHVAANQYSPISDLWALMPREHATAYMSAVSQLCCWDCWWRSPPLPWESRALRRGHSPSAASAEGLLAAQLFIHSVPVHPGYIPFTLVRAGHVGTPTSLHPECTRWSVCNTTTSALEDVRSDRGPEYWPACDPYRMQRCNAGWGSRSAAARLQTQARPVPQRRSNQPAEPSWASRLFGG